MNTPKKLLCLLTAAATLGAATPVFADPWHDRGRDQNRSSYRDHDRHGYRGHNRPPVAVVQRPYVIQRTYAVERPYAVQRPYYVEQPAYYGQPAPMAAIGMGALIGAVIGGIIDSQR